MMACAVDDNSNCAVLRLTRLSKDGENQNQELEFCDLDAEKVAEVWPESALTAKYFFCQRANDLCPKNQTGHITKYEIKCADKLVWQSLKKILSQGKMTKSFSFCDVHNQHLRNVALKMQMLQLLCTEQRMFAFLASLPHLFGDEFTANVFVNTKPVAIKNTRICFVKKNSHNVNFYVDNIHSKPIPVNNDLPNKRTLIAHKITQVFFYKHQHRHFEKFKSRVVEQQNWAHKYMEREPDLYLPVCGTQMFAKSYWLFPSSETLEPLFELTLQQNLLCNPSEARKLFGLLLYDKDLYCLVRDVHGQFKLCLADLYTQ